MDDTQRSLIRDLSTSPGTFWCVHLPQLAPGEREPLKQEVLVHLLNCVKSRGQSVAVARMAEPHRGLRSLFRVETCAEWLRKEAGMSAQQAHAAIANIKSFGVHVAHKLNQIAANPRWMLGYAAASCRQPDVLVYGTDGMDPMGVKAAHRYMEALAERCCVIHMSPRSTDQLCPPGAKCIQLEGGHRPGAGAAAMREDDLITELEWLTSHDAWRMLKLLDASRSRPSKRKIRLFNVAICRRFWEYLPETSQAILLESEQLADRLLRVSSDELCRRANAAVAPIDQKYPTKQFPNEKVRIQRYAAVAVCYAVISNDLWGAAAALWEIDKTARETHSSIIRDVFGNPFTTITIDRAWVTPEVHSLAQHIYDDRSFGRLPALAELLGIAGCENDDILDHCSHGGAHVRGCWVVDLILGRK